MLRALRIFLLALIACAALLVIGFRIWTVQQPPQTRLAVEAMTLRELLVAIGYVIASPPAQDFAAFGRREAPGRGHAPWVVRSSLDGRPRMLSLALAPQVWLAYSTETTSMHQLWRGDVDFTGPAFDEKHGGEPLSRGVVLSRGEAETAWRVRGAEGWEPARVRWRAYGVEDGGRGRAWLRFDVGDRAGKSRSVTERPELVGWSANAPRDAAAPIALERAFEIAGGDGPEIALALGPSAGRVETDRAVTDAGLLLIGPGSARVVQRFDGPGEPIAPAAAPPGLEGAFADHACLSCHNERERVVGPAWSEIAARHAGANAEAAAASLARSIREGSVGRWGQVPMPPHLALAPDEARALAQQILATEVDAESDASSESEAGATTHAYDVEPRLTALHPALTATPITPAGFTPRVGGLAWLPDGRLAVATWDRDGAIFAIEGWDGPAERVRVQRIAEGLHEPLGLAFADGALHVIQKQEITRLVDGDGDGWVDEYRALANGWSATSNFHEFGFGLPASNGFLYAGLSVCVLEGGASCAEQTPDRGKLMRVSLVTGAAEFVASGLRTPNGVAAGPDGAIFVTDNQGAWLPASKLIRVEAGADYGWRAPGAAADAARVTPPTLWLPQNEIGNSPTQPSVLTRGPYAGQLLWGDIYNGGLKRGALEEVEGRHQGAAFHFSGGLRAPVNRLLAAPDGSLVAGEVGSRGNWGELDKAWYGLELLRFGGEPAFEPLRVALRRDGFDVVLTRPLARDSAPIPNRFRVQDWRLVPTASYGGPKHDVRTLAVRAPRVSADRRTLSLDVAGLAPGRVVYLRLDPALRSERGEKLWVNEAWYTLNALPSARAAAPSAKSHNELSAAERAEGWELLFDGHSFAGWKNYGADGDAVVGWAIRDGALEFTRNVSFAGLLWNHLNPWGTPALDLMTMQRFRSFELSIDWRLEPGGNSGIFYAVPDENDRIAWTRALEMQVLDDARHADGKLEKHRAGDLYDLAASERRVVRPAGEWNSARIRVEGARIEHWLNGVRVVAIERGTPAWERALAESKFASTPGFGTAREGHILLQDHGDAVWFRNVKLRRLPD